MGDFWVDIRKYINDDQSNQGKSMKPQKKIDNKQEYSFIHKEYFGAAFELGV